MKKILFGITIMMIFFQQKTKAITFIQDEVIVKYKSSSLNLSRTEDTDRLKVIKHNKSLEEALKEFDNDPNIEYVQPNYVYEKLDRYSDQLWGINNTGQNVNGFKGSLDADIDAIEAWGIEGDKTISVGVIDTGVAYSHPDLSSNILKGYDFVDNDNTPYDLDGHGTHISGIISGISNNNKGITGLSLKNKIKVVPIRFNLTTYGAIKAIKYAKDNNIKIINASWGSYNYDKALKDAIAAYPGLFVCAAGNNHFDHNKTPFYPSDYNLDNIISVAATDQNDQLANFSDYGISSVDIAAPGVNILSTFPGKDHTGLDGEYIYMSGTSMAAPFVAGTAAMILSKDPSLSISEIKNIILGTGDSIKTLENRIKSGRRLNLYNALNYITEKKPEIYKIYAYNSSLKKVPIKEENWQEISNPYIEWESSNDSIGYSFGLGIPDDIIDSYEPYTNNIVLHEGKNTFMVKSKNKDNIWSEIKTFSLFLKDTRVYNIKIDKLINKDKSITVYASTEEDTGKYSFCLKNTLNTWCLEESSFLIPQNKQIQYSFNNLQPNTRYSIVAKSINQNTWGTPSHITTLASTISPFTINYTNNAVKLFWELYGSSGVEIYRNEKNIFCDNSGTPIYKGNGRQFIDKNIEPNKFYFYTIFSINDEGIVNKQCSQNVATTFNMDFCKDNSNRN